MITLRMKFVTGVLTLTFLHQASVRATSQVGATPPPSTDASNVQPNKGAAKPGRDRWAVKTGSDLDSARIESTPVKTTVEDLLAIQRPVDMPLDTTSPWMQEHRAGPAETTVWAVEADMTSCQLMPDGDFRITICGASGQAMILEMPDPDPAFVNPLGPFAKAIKAARLQFQSKLTPQRTLSPMKIHAVITGIGFFARNFSKKEAVKGNLMQLHPVLNIDWLENPLKKSDTPEKTDNKKENEKPAPKQK